MRPPTPARSHRIAAARATVLAVTTVLALSSLAVGLSTETAAARDDLGRVVSFHGFQIQVPLGWRVVDLASHPDACLRLDRPSVYLGPAGDQTQCPARLIGGAPVVQIEAATAAVVGDLDASVLTLASPGNMVLDLPRVGPVAIAVPAARVVVTVTYGPADAGLVRGILQGSQVVAGARQGDQPALPHGLAATGVGVSVPGDYRGLGFDTCTAPAQAVMDSWRAASPYQSIGIYIGGVSMGCAQPNLSAAWVARQVSLGWHLVPVYVGLQAPCTRFDQRISYDLPTAREQGIADATDAMERAALRGIVAPSTLYADLEGYDSSNESCVAAVMSYVTGWTFALHTGAYQSGVYSSASSGIRDLSSDYDKLGGSRPDDLFMAWWNHHADVDGGSYVPAYQWRYQQRVHQFEGETTERHGDYSMNIDVNFLDVNTVVQAPVGCPTNLDFTTYPFLRWPRSSVEVQAAQCLLAGTGFDPGAATGTFTWRTAAASRGFKASRGLDSTESSIAKYAWTALLSAGTTRPIQLGSTGPWVRKAQRALTARLQTVVTIDGVFTHRTRRAVLDYQREVGLAPTGIVFAPTWRALRSGS